jgi:adenylosuccinate lyase
MTAIKKEISLKEALLQRDDVKNVLSEKDLTAVMEPANYIGGAKDIVDKMVSAAEEVLERKV